ncbi:MULTISPECIES: hypothetical protein [Acinetobacter calcoaceticus/baumannii complex]|uniref:hypothetical protein n=1 Tax=Acinetobacter calcoaceticus/baumannii complex TaxID=909768 RepID=UPI00226F05A2|nr:MULTISPECIES: hypothetical protein [Acinetobacter calcoaceticus/baumannii complex]MDD9317870.1 hypothetical protein [Acinetobacter lactucae]
MNSSEQAAQFQESENSVYGTEIHEDANGVVVTHNEWVQVENSQESYELNHGHYYDILAGDEVTPIQFQHGPVKEHGVNGVTSEALLAILIHRTKILDNNFPCDENKRAITYMENALALFEQRTRDRQKRGVEGFNKA